MRRISLEQLALAAFVGSALVAFARSYESPVSWALFVPCLISLFWRIRHLPPRLAAFTRYVAWAFVAGAAVVSLFLQSYPILSAETARLPTLALGYGLAVFCVLFLLGTPVWSPASTLIPAALGAWVVSAFKYEAHLGWVIAWAGGATFVYLALESRKEESQAQTADDEWRPSSRLVLAALGVSLIAVTIIRLLPWAQVRITQAAVRLYVALPTQYSSLSGDSRLGDLEQLKLSKKTVMRVWTSQPQKLRGRVFTQFDGQAWHSHEPATNELPPVPASFSSSPALGEWLKAIPGTAFMIPAESAEPSEMAEDIRTKIVQEVFNNGMLVAPGGILLVRLPAQQLRMDALGDLNPSSPAPIRIYGVVSRREDNVAMAESAGPGMIRDCLRLPPDTDPRLREIARQLAEGARAPEDRLHRTVNYVQNACHYSLTVGKFHSRQPVAEFLFEKKQGYCEYFASAAALLLRLEGVPSRYVTGFNIQEGNFQGGHYLVRESDAHAWIEVYLAGQGWVEADPTPGEEYAALHADLDRGWLEAAIEWLAGEFAELSIRLSAPDWLASFHWLWRGFKALLRVVFGTKTGLVLILLAGLAALSVKIRRRKRSLALEGAREALHDAPDAASVELADLMRRLDGVWARQGFARPASRAPLEHLVGIPPEKMTADLGETSRKVVDCFYRSFFGGTPIVPAELAELKRVLASGRRESR